MQRCKDAHPAGWVFQEGHLPGDLLGLTCWEQRTVTVDSRLTEAERRCTLAHEITHIERGRFPCWVETLEESIVDGLVACRLIPLEALVDAVAWSRDPHEIADQLGVDVHTLEARAQGLTAEERDVLRVA